MIYLNEEDLGQEEDPTYFKVKLAYNGIHHYIPIVPSNIVDYFEAVGQVKDYTRGARDSLKLLMGYLPKTSNYYKLVECAYAASISTTTVLSGINPLTGATGTAGAATPAEIFGYPVPEKPSSSSKRRKLAAPAAPQLPQLLGPEPGTAEQTPSGTQEQEGGQEELVFQLQEADDSPDITVKKHEELKHGSDQCFCGQGDLKTKKDKDKHFKTAHHQKGRGINPKTGKKNDLWACSSCKKVCRDNRAVWKHFRTQHINMFIHYCPIDGCDVGNDQKDAIVSHILRDHRSETEWVAKCYAQKWLLCPKCLKFFMSVKGKHAHVPLCGKPKIRLNCPYEHCFKTYTSEESLDSHIKTTHEGKAHKCLCPHCGLQLSSKQNLDNHIAKEHKEN